MERTKLITFNETCHRTVTAEHIMVAGKNIVRAVDELEIIDQAAKSIMKIVKSIRLTISYYDLKEVLHHFEVAYAGESYTIEKSVHLHQFIDVAEGIHINTHKLSHEDEHIGFLNLIKSNGRVLLECEEKAIKHIGDFISIAIVNYKKTQRHLNQKLHLEAKTFHMMQSLGQNYDQHDHLLKLSYMDKLTQCYNRRHYEENLNLLGESDYLPLGIVVADVNSLKVFNDAFGHVIGDELLKVVANVLKETFSTSGYVSRVGGDEFTVLMPNINEEKLTKMVERVQTNLDKVTSLPIKPSLSIGKTIHTKNTTLHDALNVAENLMYEQKLVSSSYVKRTIVTSLKKKLNNYASQNQQSVVRLKELALSMGDALELTPDQKEKLSLLAEIHNIGEVGINRALFSKSARLTLKEHDLLKSHVKRGYRIVNASSELNKIAEEMLSHHENWDGSGYPRSISGHEIPIISRAFSVIDAYNAMMTEKPYRGELTKREIVCELCDQASKQFDPRMVEVFVSKVLKR